MRKGGDFAWLLLYVFFSEVHPTATCTFSKVIEEFAASSKIQIVIENEEICILACYEESDCVYVEYDGSTCSVYKEGNEIQKAVGTTYKLDRHLSQPSCPRRVEVGVQMSFPKYEAPTAVPSSCVDSTSTPTTTISMYRRKGGDNFFTSMPNPALPVGGDVYRRITLARDPQSNCKPLPVFTRANHRRLYFGSVFNVTGYYFMNGYAFADYCVCDDGACCGKVNLKEMKEESSYWYQQFISVHPSATCTFSKVNNEFVANFKVQIIIENEEICIMACYEEPDCVYVEYAGSLCSIYTQGNKTQKAVGAAFKLDRQLLKPSCPRRVKSAAIVAFPRYLRPSAAPISCLNSSSTPTTTISMYRKNGDDSFYTSNPNPVLPVGSEVYRRITLARDPQSNCKPLPVFTSANHRRLYLGSVFNITGYYFMNGYAFADFCVCDDGACCGSRPLREAEHGNQYLYNVELDGGDPTPVDEPFFVKSFWMKA